MNSRVGSRLENELSTSKLHLHHIENAVSIFGSARTPVDDPYYQDTVDIAHMLSEEGISVISGGGPGIMQAANQGAQSGGYGKSVGLNIILPFEQKGNPYQDISIDFDHFASRKVVFCQYADAFIAMPGGFGTLDELFEVLTLIQTGKMPKMPIILYGESFWKGLLDWTYQTLLGQSMISEEDLQLFHICNTPQEAMQFLRHACPHLFGNNAT